MRKLFGVLAVCAAALLPGLALAAPGLAAIPLINGDEDIECFGGPDGCASTRFIEFVAGNQPYVTVTSANSTTDFGETNCVIASDGTWCHLLDLQHNNACMNAVGSGPLAHLVVPSGCQSNFTPEQWKRTADGRGWDYENRHFGENMGQCFGQGCLQSGHLGDIAIADGTISNGNAWTLPAS